MSELLNGNQQWVDSGGNPIVNGKIYIGTQGNEPIANPKSIFSDRALSSALTNPQTLDSNGFATNKIWLSGTYSLKVVNSADVTLIQELDNGEPSSTSLSSLGNVLGTNTITGDSTPTITAYEDLALFVFQTVAKNTGDVTLNIDGVGAKSIKKNLNEQIPAQQFEDNQDVIVVYNKSEDVFEWVNHNEKLQFMTQASSIASAATTSIFDALGNYVFVTGTTTITSFGTAPVVGSWRIIVFIGALTLTDGASLITPGSANITTANGDYCFVFAESTTQHRVAWYTKDSGLPLRDIVQAAVAAGAIGQSQLKTLQGEVSTSGTGGTLLVLPGGEYGFYPRVKYSGVNSGTGQLFSGVTGTSFVTNIWMFVTTAGTITANQRYVDASPPYDMGDGEVYGFIFGLVEDATNKIIALYQAADPPWANNGPTNIRPDRIDLKTGKKYKSMKSISKNITRLMEPDFLQEAEMEVTHAFKNSDMNLIPHPFGGLEGNPNLVGFTPILFDPMSRIVERLEEVMDSGGDVGEIIYGDYLKIGNTELGRGKPDGVMSVSVAMK